MDMHMDDGTKGRRLPARRGVRLRHMMLATVGAALLLWAAHDHLAILAFAGILLAMVAAIVPVVAALKLRATRQEGLLRLLAMSMEGGIPPGPAVGAYADLCGLGQRRKLRTLAGHLDGGASLPDALASVRGVIPDDTLGFLRMGWLAGDPAGALRDAVAVLGPWRPHRQGVARVLAYAVGMLLLIQAIAALMAYFITPRYVRILQDFQMQAPPLTRLVFGATAWLAERWPFALAVGLVELAVGLPLLLLLMLYDGGTGLRVPLLDRVYRRGHTAAILRALAPVVEGRRPIVEGLGALARFYPRPWVRDRLRMAEWRAREGEPWSASLRGEGLIRASDEAVLDAAQRAGNLSWALRELAEGSERRSAYRLNALSRTLLPLVVLALGALVGLFAVAYLLPLVTMIRELAE